MTDVTQVLSAMQQGDPLAASELLPLVYQELRRIACSGGHPACRRAAASSPAEQGHAMTWRSDIFQRAGQVGRFFRVAGRTPSTAVEPTAATERGIHSASPCEVVAHWKNPVSVGRRELQGNEFRASLR